MSTFQQRLNPLISATSRGFFGFLASLFALATSPPVHAQGCIASRGSSLTPCQYGEHLGEGEVLPPSSGFQAQVGYRWLHSDSMFVHDVEQTQLETHGGQEINDQHFIDVGLSYAFNSRVSVTLTLPFAVNDRSEPVYRSPTVIVDRFHTQASGFGDLRLEANAWLLDPNKHMKGNILVGMGLSAPSGDRDVQDTFEAWDFRARRIATSQHAVDQSIQLGVGGWGMVVDLYAYQQILPRLNGFVNGSYTMTPEEKYTPTASRDGDYSIPDSYLARGGLEFFVWPKHSLSVSLAGRVEGVPVHDLVGGSDGFRRPGYAVSIEPGVSLAIRSWSIMVNTPVAVYRNRQASVLEQAAGTEPVAAGFADLVVTCSISKRF